MSFDAASEYARVIARDTGLAAQSAECIVITEATRRFVGRMVEVMATGNGYVRVDIQRKRLLRVDWKQSDFFDAAY